MKSERQSLSPIEIRTCANGFVVTPATNGNGWTSYENQVNVFANFDALVSWLRDHLKRPKEKQR